MTEDHLRRFTFETFRLDGQRVSDEEAQNMDLCAIWRTNGRKNPRAGSR